MRQFSRLFFVAFVLLASRVFVFAQDDVLILKDEDQSSSEQANAQPVEASEPEVTNQLFMEFYDDWRQFELQLKLGEVDEKIIGDIIRLRNKNGIPKLTEFALSAIRFGQDRLQDGKPDQAVKLFQAAVNLDPSISEAYYDQARALFAQSVFNIPKAISIAIAGVFAPANTFNGKIYLYSKYTAIVAATLLILGAAFALIMLVKYHTLLRHDLIERFASIAVTTINIAMWFVLFLPAIAFAGVLWLAPFWMMMFWKYMRLPERALSALFFLVFLFVYPAYQHIVHISSAMLDPSLAPFVRVYSDGPSPRLLSDFRSYEVDNPADADASIMLAHLYRADRNLTEATRVLQKHILDHPNDGRAYNNLAHIYFLQGETDIALRMVLKAQTMDTGNAIYPFNVSILQRAKFNFGEAEDSLARARNLDKRLIARFEENPYLSMIDAIPTEKMILEKIENKAGSFSGELNNPFSIFAAVLFAMAIVLTPRGKRKKDFAKECIKCGKPFCRKCQPTVKDFPFCTQCLHIFVKKDGVSPASRKEKIREIEDYSRRQQTLLRVSSFVIPGFANLYKNRTWFGAIIMLFWFLFLIFIFYNFRFSHLSFYESPGSANVLLPLCILLLALLYTVANISIFIRRKT
jgi:tetratricopeptide (TPR) repeat protein